MVERLINESTNGELWIYDTDHTRSKDKLNAVMEKLYKYEKEEAEGKLIHLPCKIGTPVYELYYTLSYGEIGDNAKKCFHIRKISFDLSMLYDLGITIFLTEESAKTKLSEIDIYMRY